MLVPNTRPQANLCSIAPPHTTLPRALRTGGADVGGKHAASSVPATSDHSSPSAAGKIGLARQQAVTNPRGTAGGHVRAKLRIGAAARQSQTPVGLLAAKAAVRDCVPLLSRQGRRDPQTAKRVVALQRGSHRPTKNCWQQCENKAGEWRCSEAVTDPHGTAGSKGSCEGRCSSPVPQGPAGPTDSKAKRLQPLKHGAAAVRTPNRQAQQRQLCRAPD